MSHELTSYLDTAQVTLYLFWAFFAGLIYWLRKEDRREGYPLESDNPRLVGNASSLLIPTPKQFLLPEGGSYSAPSFERDVREVQARRTSKAAGAPLEPEGNPMLAGVGPGAYALRHDAPELMRDGTPAVVPMRAAEQWSVYAGRDPRGMALFAADGKQVGRVVDIWVDKADAIARYLEIALDGETESRRLVPIPMLLVDEEKGRVDVAAIHSHQFSDVPQTAAPDTITLLEEEKISAYFAAGRLYADPKRLGPVV